MDQLRKKRQFRPTGIKGDTVCSVESRIKNGGDEVIIELVYEGTEDIYGQLYIPKSAVSVLARNLLDTLKVE